MAGLRRLGFTKSALYDDLHQRLYDLMLYLLGGHAAPTPDTVLREMILREDRITFPTYCDAARYLSDLWLSDVWLADMRKWSTMDHPDTGYYAWAALAAAAKVKHLEARRHAAQAARELLLESLSPTGGVEEIEGRIDNLEEM